MCRFRAAEMTKTLEAREKLKFSRQAKKDKVTKDLEALVFNDPLSWTCGSCHMTKSGVKRDVIVKSVLEKCYKCS